MPAELLVRVIPRAKRAGIDGRRGEAILVRLHSPPADGEANAELIDLLAAVLDVPKRAVTIVAGQKSRLKRIQIVGLDDATAYGRLTALGANR